MQVNPYISALIQYGLSKNLFDPCDQTYIANRILEVLHLDEFRFEETRAMPLEEILKGLLDDAVRRGICGEDTTSRDLFDTKIMGLLTAMPREVVAEFKAATGGNCSLSALVEDSLFDVKLWYPVALCAEILWDCDADVSAQVRDAAQRPCAVFA